MVNFALLYTSCLEQRIRSFQLLEKQDIIRLKLISIRLTSTFDVGKGY